MWPARPTLSAPHWHVVALSPPSIRRVQMEWSSRFPLTPGASREARMERGGLIPMAPGAYAPPPASGHAIGKAPPMVEMDPRPRRPARPIGRATQICPRRPARPNGQGTQNSRLLLLLLLLPPNPATAFLSSASPTASPTASPPCHPYPSSSAHLRHGSLPSRPHTPAVA